MRSPFAGVIAIGLVVIGVLLFALWMMAVIVAVVVETVAVIVAVGLVWEWMYFFWATRRDALTPKRRGRYRWFMFWPAFAMSLATVMFHQAPNLVAIPMLMGIMLIAIIWAFVVELLYGRATHPRSAAAWRTRRA